MEKKNYIVPAITVNEFEGEVLMSSVSSAESLKDTKFGGDATKMDADTKERDSWDEGLW